MLISLIVAVSENNVIGKNNDLPWKLPADMQYFKKTTIGHCIIMGRKNFNSIPDRFRPLEGRTNIVVTRQKNFHAEGALAVNSIEEAIAIARDKSETECFIIGGGEIFSQSIGMCDRIYLTRIHHEFDGDIFFPSLDASAWMVLTKEYHEADEKNKFPFTFLVYEKAAKEKG